MQEQSHINELILASGSPYRKMQLERLPVAFVVTAPDIDESARADESPDALVSRLAAAKADAVAASHPEAFVIGSDQGAECGGNIVGKPGSRQRALEQLASFSGRSVRFLSALAIVNEASGFRFEHTEDTVAVFRTLSTSEIERYLALDEPYDCAGSFKSEQAGTALLERMSSDDPSAIMGLPMIALARGLRLAGFTVP